MKIIHGKLIALALCVSLGACSNNNEATPTGTGGGDSLTPSKDTNGTAAATNNTAVSAVDSADALFLQEAYKGGMKEIACSQKAKEKATSKDAKDIADMMIAEHTAMNEKIKGIALAKKVVVPEVLPADVQDKINNNTKTGKDFDKDYAAGMVADHKEAIAKFEMEVKNGKDGDVKTLAQSALPDLKKHFEHVESLQKKL